MKYALITDNCTQWLSYLVSIFDTGEVVDYYEIPSNLKNPYLDNLYNRDVSFSSLRLVIPALSIDSWTGSWISGYEFTRVKKMIQLYPAAKELERLGNLERIDIN